MKRLSFALLPLFVLALGCTISTSSSSGPAPSPEPVTVGQGGKVELTPTNTKIEFVGTKPDGKHDGGFNRFTGTIELADKPAGKNSAKIAGVNIAIETGSLFSDVPKLTSHLKRADFFDVEKFPKATFKSTKVELVESKGNTEKANITGDLELHGVTKPITIPVTYSTGSDFTLDSTFELNRNDFGMNYGPGKIHDKVTVKVTIGKSK